MSLDKYYDALYVDGKLNNSYVTYLSYIHMYNSLVKRDNVTNDTLSDLGVNYAKRAHDFYQACDYPLVYLKDDIYLLYEYTINHIENILEKPHKDIVKKKKLIRKEKLKTVDSKTLVWLANKPGSSIREKLSNVEKVSSTVKRYTYNIKENQVLLAFFKDISRLLNTKSTIMKNNPTLFGEEEFAIIDEITRRLNRVRFHFKNELEEVVAKDYSTPNNTLIGNVDYASVWKSYTAIKQSQVDTQNSFNKYKEMLKSIFVFTMMNRYDYVESYGKVNEANNYILFDKSNDVLTEVVISGSNDFEIVIKKYDLNNNTSLIETNNYIVEMFEKDLDSYRGQAYSLLINNKVVGVFYADVLGCKEVIYQIVQTLGLLVNEKVSVINYKRPYKYASINSLDSKLYTEDYSLNCNACFNGIMFENNDIYFSNGNNCYLNSYKNDNYSSFLKLVSKTQDFGANGIVVYDINDNFDEFSSAELRRNFTAIYPQSYPVWRSILVGESSKDKDKVRTVLDFCGKDFSISKLERKNKKFVHCGPIEIPIYYQIINEKSCYEIYISEYEKKYNITFPNEFIDNMIASGGLYSVLIKNKKEYISLVGNNDLHKVYSIGFDSECYYKMVEEFEVAMNVILDKYDKDSTMAVIPDFLNSLSNNRVITNESLLIGVDTIIERINSHEVTWYEKLPKLSLEIIKNGMFDNLVLIDNQECENIIGKKLTIQVQDKLTLSAGQANYILPLNKSFIGEQNEAFVAKAIDPSFPLSEDMEVKLVLEYSFGAENSYNLFLYPADGKKKSPFEKIEIIWEKEHNDVQLIYPSIGGKYSNTNFEKEIFMFKSNCEYINKCCGLLRKKTFNGNNKMIYGDIRKNTYIHQNMITGGVNPAVVNQIMEDNHYFENLRYLHSLMINNYKKEEVEKYKEIAQWNLEDIECAMVECFRDIDHFADNYLIFPETCYGWYFSYKHDDSKVISEAYSALLKMSELDNYLSSKKLRMHFQTITGAATNNYMMTKNIAKVNSSYVRYFLKIIIKIMKEMADYDYNVFSEDKNNNPKENAFLMRYCIEILISYLFVRELPEFDGLKPSGSYSKEIIYYLKKFNKKYVAVTDWFGKEPNMKSKYNMQFDNQPKELKSMLPEIYCLILYLSGDSRANYIKIGTGD